MTETLGERGETILLPNGETANRTESFCQGLKLKDSGTIEHLNRAQNLDIESFDRQIRVPGHTPRKGNSWIGGDELLDGPFYNYARCGTWSYVANSIIQGYAHALSAERTAPSRSATTSTDGIQNGDMYTPLETVVSVPSYFDATAQLVRPNGFRRNSSFDLRYAGPLMKCKFNHAGHLYRFGWKIDSSLKELKSHIWTTKAIAFGIAFALQSIIGWSAVIIAYNTPTIGIGCRSFTYMTFTLLSIFCCILFILASHFSDIECARREIDSTEFRPSQLRAAGAICCRFVGRFLAILNAIIVIMGCVFEFAGVFESCFCKSSRIGLGERAYITFLTSAQSAQIARPYWIAGASVPIIVIFILSIGYFELSKHKWFSS